MRSIYSDPKYFLSDIVEVDDIKIMPPHVYKHISIPQQIFFKLNHNKYNAPPLVYMHLEHPKHIEKINDLWWRIMRIEDVKIRPYFKDHISYYSSMQ